MRIDRLTSKMQHAFADAQSMAVGQSHNELSPVHLLLALLDQQGSPLTPLIKQSGSDAARVRVELKKLLEQLPTVSQYDGNVQVSQSLGRLLNLADRDSQQRGDQYISSELVLLSAMELGDATSKALEAAGLDKKRLAVAIENLRGGEAV